MEPASNLISPRIFSRRGGAIIWLVLLIVICCSVSGAAFFLGKAAEARFGKNLADGMTAVEQDKGDVAADSFGKAAAENSIFLSFFRKISGFSGKTFYPFSDVDQMIISALMMKAYDEHFALKPAIEWVDRAEHKLRELTGTETQDLAKTVATAKAVSNLCSQFENRKYTEVLKDLLQVEKNAQPTDQDFFIMEVRLLIACGKALKEPAILAQARELLFFISTEVGIKGPKIDNLWQLLYK